MSTRNPTSRHFQKNSYKSPRLVKYGRVAKLTEAANSGSNENSKGNNPHMLASDPRCKENVLRIGTHWTGIGLYLFEYKPEYRDTCGYGRKLGVMADEAERVIPEAVSMHPEGHKMVDYAMLGISRTLQ